MSWRNPRRASDMSSSCASTCRASESCSSSGHSAAARRHEPKSSTAGASCGWAAPLSSAACSSRLGVGVVRPVQDAQLGCADQAPAAGHLHAVLVQVALTTIGSGALQSALSIVAMSILPAGTVLPALSGVTLWIGRQSPARLWAAEQLIRGKAADPRCLRLAGRRRQLRRCHRGGRRARRLGGADAPRIRPVDSRVRFMRSRPASVPRFWRHHRRLESRSRLALPWPLKRSTAPACGSLHVHRRRRRWPGGRVERAAGESLPGLTLIGRHERGRRTCRGALLLPRFPRRLDRGHRRRARHRRDGGALARGSPPCCS